MNCSAFCALFWCVVLIKSAILPANANPINLDGSPNDWIVGVPTKQTALLHSQRVTENGTLTAHFDWSGELIQRIEALDQLNGAGGFVSEWSGGVSFDYVSIFFASWWTSEARIDFVVNIYGDDSGHGTGANDIIDGDLNERSFLVHSERVVDSHFSWENSSFITRMEILDQTNGTDAAQRISWHGGVRQRFLRFFVLDDGPNVRVDYLVKIYTEPQDITLGFETADTRLVYTQHVVSCKSQRRFYWSSPIPVTKIEALDQTNGTGGFVDNVTGLDNLNVVISFVTIAPHDRIDFIVNLFGERASSNDLIIGDRTETSVLLLTEHLSDTNVADRFWSHRSREHITQVELLDGMNGAGPRVEHYTVNPFEIHIWFSMDASDMDFTVNVYGERNEKGAGPNDLIVGEVSQLSWVVDRVQVHEARWSVATYVFESEHILTRVEILDQQNGRGGRPSIVHGGVGERSLVVLFTADETQESILFEVTVFAG